MTLQQIAPTQLGLLALCGVLTLALAFESMAPVTPYDVPPSTEIVRPPAVTIEDAASAPSSAAFDEIVARPLFNPMRKPAVAKDDAAKQAAGPAFPSDVSLIGVLIAGEQRMAFVKNTGAAFAGSVQEGNEIEGWSVAEIDADRIVLQYGESKQDILLANNRAPAQGSTPPARTVNAPEASAATRADPGTNADARSPMSAAPQRQQ